jgi:hypothetical protein
VQTLRLGMFGIDGHLGLRLLATRNGVSVDATAARIEA